MKVFLTLLFSVVSMVAFAGEAPVAPEPASVVAKDCDSCSTNNCTVRRGLFGRRRFFRSTEYSCNKSGSTYSRTRCVTDGCDNVLRSRTHSRTICNGNSCDCK
jgi:hypothetical protein